jgi:N-acetylneuraminic acid mutarotase
MVSYKMLGLDLNATPFPQYRTWAVSGTPDYTAQYYTGDKSGSNALFNITAYAIVNPAEAYNFNLPNPLAWSPTRQVLPTYISDSQVAIVDGYLYLFGGAGSNAILIASVDNPTLWSNTGATLPTPLAGSQLAIINNTIYLFGGATDGTLASPTANIYTAPVSNPLNWTNHGALLPAPLHHAQLGIAGNNLYLFGGNGVNAATNTIYTAPITNPLVWSNTLSVLPVPLYGSQLGIINNSLYLFGGLLSPNSPTANIYSASISIPTSWSLVGALPYPAAYGQFAIVGSQGFLFTPTVSTASNTRILSCNLTTPAQWVDTNQTIKASLSQSQLAIVNDRLFLLGGNGNTAIMANHQYLAYSLNGAPAVSYNYTTRTAVSEAPTELALFQVLGFPPWRTDYGAFGF